MRTRSLLALAAAGAMTVAAPAAAQDLTPQTRTVMTPMAPPAVVVTPTGPNQLTVTPVPGVATATVVRVQNFMDYDRNRDGLYNPMEFAQAVYFLATSDPVAGNPRLPAIDRFVHRGAPQEMAPANAIALLNATADEFAAVDMNNDWRVSPAELAAFSML